MAKAATEQASKSRLRRLIALLGLLVVVLAGRELMVRSRQRRPIPRPDSPLTMTPLETPRERSGTMFESLPPDRTGIDFVGRIVPDHERSYLYETGFTSGGVAIGDVDNDGLVDVYLSSGPDGNRLYRQIGDFRFEDVTEKAGVDGGGAWSAGVAIADVDDDGRLDIYVCNYDSPNLLYMNQGGGVFQESADQYGLSVVDACIMAAFSDYDLDGDLDLYVMGNRYVSPDGRPAQSPLTYDEGKVRIRPEYQRYFQLSADRIGYARAARSDALFRNDGENGFTVVTREAGIQGAFQGLSATWWDYNEDGWPDLYVGNDYQGPDQLYRNDRNGAFTDVIQQAAPHTTWFSMGAEAADLDNDGRIDLAIADMARTSHLKRITSMGPMASDQFQQMMNPPQLKWNAVLLNPGVGRFIETARMMGMDRTNWTWAVKLADFDNDGRVDAYYTNGFSRDFTDADYPVSPDMLIGRSTWEVTTGQETLLEQDLAYRNVGDLQFEEVSGEWGLDAVGISMSSAYGDLDRDGDLDLITYSAVGPPLVYRNNALQGRRALIRLDGAASNRFGLGAVARLTAGGATQVRAMSTMTGYLSTNEPVLHFGLGDAEVIDELTIDWPSGQSQTFRGLPVDHVFRIAEPDGPRPPRKMPQPKPTLYRLSRSLRDAIHREVPFDDFAVQPLLPHKLSQFGPSLAWADVDDDGDDDLFQAGAAGESGSLWINRGRGRFARRDSLALSNDAECEDMGAVWFDADADGDADLFVVSGSVEIGDDPALLEDRLYLNDGAGNLSRSSDDAVPELRDSGGPAAAADFDRDGDLDLFIGGRLTPGQYPSPADSRLLRNEGGRLVDATEAAAPELLSMGMASGGLWTDVDADGWLDLLVACPWGPIKLFRNDQGRLVDRTEAAGLADRLGWWTGITGRDVDNDGDIDYVATNLGRNTQYRASEQRPATLFYGDFEGLGERRIVEAAYEGSTLVPTSSRERLLTAMPTLAERFPTYASFGAASVEEILTTERSTEARILKMNFLDSAVLLNDGSGRFNVQSLPAMAQTSPAFGSAMTDYDSDGNADLYLVQNFYGPYVEFGPMDGGLSVLLQGDGNGRFVAVEPADSGLVVPGDAKSLTRTDLNGDGREDFVIGMNNGPIVSYLRNDASLARAIRIRLHGRRGNPTAIGAKVTVRLDDGALQTAELYAGDGYLSQSAAELRFGLGEERMVDAIEVRWPTGETSTATPDRTLRTIVIRQP